MKPTPQNPANLASAPSRTGRAVGAGGAGGADSVAPLRESATGRAAEGSWGATAGFRSVQVLLGIVLTVTILYFGRSILVPFALAVLFAMLLHPIVHRLERWIGRIASVVTVVSVLMLSALGVGWIVSLQLVDLANRIPVYQKQLVVKLERLRGSDSSSGTMHKFQQAMDHLMNAIEAGTKPPAEPPKDEPFLKEILDGRREPQKVQVVPEPTSRWAAIAIALTSLANPLATFGIVTVLVIFLLIQREDVRDRVVRLMGTGKLTLTTNTLGEMGSRISRYLLMNALVNGGYGVAVTVGLLTLGIDYALLWGFLSGVLRFLPYIGPIAATVLPVAMAAVQFESWMPLIYTGGLFLILELFTNNVIEPLAYGRSAGVSIIAILVTATFWTWVWGPVGLVLSVPMTVMLAVLGKHVPQLQSLGIALGDEPPLETYVIYYQRLLAGDQEEAESLLEEHEAQRGLVGVYDSIVVPALALAERDRVGGQLSPRQIEFIWKSTEDLIDELAVPDPMVGGDAAVEPALEIRMLGCAVQDRADALALRMLSNSLQETGGTLDAMSDSMLAAELLEHVERDRPDVLFLSALGGGGAVQLRYLLKRIRQRERSLNVVVCRWGYPGAKERMANRMREWGASRVVTTLGEAVQIARSTPRMERVPVAESVAAN